MSWRELSELLKLLATLLKASLMGWVELVLLRRWSAVVVAATAVLFALPVI